MSLGDGALPSGLNQFVAATAAGTANIGYQEVFFGRGVTHTAPQFCRLNGVGGSGTNIAGGSLCMAGGKGTTHAIQPTELRGCMRDPSTKEHFLIANVGRACGCGRDKLIQT
jgi:hypothetical protein